MLQFCICFLCSRQVGWKYSRIPITQAFRGDGKWFELLGVRVIESSIKRKMDSMVFCFNMILPVPYNHIKSIAVSNCFCYITFKLKSVLLSMELDFA